MKKLALSFLFVATWLGCFAMKGDVNGDGTVTSTDVTALYNFLLYNDTSSLVNGDVNGDGNINSADVTVVYSILLNGPENEIVSYTVNGVTFNMIKVDGGTFMMGAADSDTEAYSLERPAHQVTLSDYWIGETEVTEKLWKAVMQVDEVSYSMGDLYPMRFVTWDQCIDFAQRLSVLTGINFTLPTEAQWEFAARGGNLSHGYLYSGSNNLDEVAWYAGNSNNVLHEVATKTPNELGIYDMCGNIAEWCLDDIYDYTTEAQVDPTHPKTTVNNMLRSSARDDVARDCRLTTRWKTNGMSIWIGFRIAIVPQS